MSAVVLARDVMSAPVRTLRPEISLMAARQRLTRYGHGAMPVVDAQGSLVGIISRRDLDIALYHGFAEDPVERFMTATVLTVPSDAPLDAIEALMVTYDIGRVPVLEAGQLVGIITRTDLLRQHHQQRTGGLPLFLPLQERLAEKLGAVAVERLARVAAAAETLAQVAYLVGGAVRDLLLGEVSADLDVVVEGRAGEAGAAPTLARTIAEGDKTLRLECFEKYQTAALTWPDGFVLDLATARTEFYPRPGANPEVESASIRLDLYRRDFTINAMAVCLNGPRAWQLMDFFGGFVDLRECIVRVLHPNSFIEDPTRIFRAVRFALRLSFAIAPQTEAFIVRSVSGGLHDLYGGERLKTELGYLLAAPFWLEGLQMLDRLGALRCVHPDLRLTEALAAGMVWLAGAYRTFAPLRATLPQLRLDRLLLAVGPEAAESLPLDGQARVRQRKVRTAMPALVRQTDWSAAGLHQHLAALSPEECLLLASLSEDDASREAIAGYQRRRREPPLVGGADLKTLGLKPGPDFRRILDAATIAQLDGKFVDREGALAWLQNHLQQGNQAFEKQ
ncbi:CBS domain-containing protein [Gloeobacter morelensis]|uniref:CBS domain-containing protein n=1 Tax=Gloeobacter morelensis MG652769 TaxID=2781736 RepID=A0ABY3PKV3_9CYAN|nr:CBS domain-containing protein [Gloeobacter morelensis]UFP94307.1 CBS domain-containing protein [Gloeobacter morelensis MG652769]